MAQEIFNADFNCPGCNEIFNFTNISKLRHVAVCKKPEEEDKPREEPESSRPTSSNQKLFKCEICFKQMHMTNIEILKHKKNCKIKEEKN
jgi:hypothetical protein